MAISKENRAWLEESKKRRAAKSTKEKPNSHKRKPRSKISSDWKEGKSPKEIKKVLDRMDREIASHRHPHKW